ncbi:30S ribosomal protein S2, partial [Candidatus Peregrinibacteria bacterium]|nr:30S ribosomal protein S2 [Candidatus Peregrinibacteria bacterium]
MIKASVNHKDHMANDQISKMLEAAVHFGHKTQKWNPKMRHYIYGSKSGIHIIDIYKTQLALEKAKEFISHMVSSGKNVMLVSTKPQAVDLIINTAKETNMPFVVNKWIGGLLTNFDTMRNRIRYYNKLSEEEKNGEFDKYTKKEASSLRKELEKLTNALGGLKEIDRKPDVLFVADVHRDEIAVKEAQKLNIPIIGICDTDADPDQIDYPIPGNDDSIKSLTYLIGEVKSAILA